MDRVDKPWGYELRFICTDRYAGKLLFIKAGSQLSLQYHERKDEEAGKPHSTASRHRRVHRGMPRHQWSPW